MRSKYQGGNRVKVIESNTLTGNLVILILELILDKMKSFFFLVYANLIKREGFSISFE